MADDVSQMGDLAHGGQRHPDLESENRALIALAEGLASDPQQLLQRLVDFALELCEAGSAGVSILEPHGSGMAFRWRATAGRLAPLAGSSMSRHACPCGVVVDRDASLLLREPIRHFPALAELGVPMPETLLVPFHVAGQPTGTVWVVSHSDDCTFDSEHARLLSSLSRFASAAHQLAVSLHAAERANEAKTQFLATISHELRTPLTGIIGYADLLASDVVGTTSPEQKEMLTRIQASSWHLVSIIEEILLLARAGAGKEEVRRRVIDVAEIIREVIQIVEPQITAKGLELRVSGTDEETPALTDGDKVRRVLINLVGNAAKYTATGEIAITLERRPHDRLAVHIEDTGPGIAEADQQRIFEPFTQCDASHTRASGGIGLGLAICHRLAGLLGGEVGVRSTPGEGSIFTFELPVAMPKG